MLPGPFLFVSCVPNVARPATFGTHYTNRHLPSSIGYTWYKQTRTWQHWIHTTQTDTGLATLSTEDKNRHWPGNIGYTRKKQLLAWQHWVHEMPGQCLFVSCVLNVATPVSVCILRTKCYQANVCLYLVYPMLIKTDTGLSTLGTQDKKRHGPGNIGYTRYKQTRAWQHWVHKIQTDTLSCVPNVARPVSVCILYTQCYHARVWFYLMGLTILGTQDKNRHWHGNIGYTR
jgi:hypothetical protein